MSDTLQVIRTFLEKRLDIPAENITPDSTLESLQIDSLLLLDLMFELEDQCNIRLSNDTPTPKTVDDIIQIIHKTQQPSATPAP